MSTQKQIEANRRNSKKSTGPRTAEGKAVSAKNALRHGLYSCDGVLPDEGKGEYRYLVYRLKQELGNGTVESEELIRLQAETLWRLHRYNCVEMELFQIWRNYKGKCCGIGTAFTQDANRGNSLSKLARCRSSDFRQMKDLLKLLKGGNKPAAGGAKNNNPTKGNGNENLEEKPS